MSTSSAEDLLYSVIGLLQKSDAPLTVSLPMSHNSFLVIMYITIDPKKNIVAVHSVDDDFIEEPEFVRRTSTYQLFDVLSMALRSYFGDDVQGVDWSALVIRTQWRNTPLKMLQVFRDKSIEEATGPLVADTMMSGGFASTFKWFNSTGAKHKIVLSGSGVAQQGVDMRNAEAVGPRKETFRQLALMYDRFSPVAIQFNLTLTAQQLKTLYKDSPALGGKSKLRRCNTLRK